MSTTNRYQPCDNHAIAMLRCYVLVTVTVLPSSYRQFISPAGFLAAPEATRTLRAPEVGRCCQNQQLASGSSFGS